MTLFSVLVDVYNKEQLVTEKEAKEAAFGVRMWKWRWKWRWESRWVGVAFTKRDVQATKIADILDKYGFNDDAHYIRGKCVCTLVCMHKYCTGSL